MENLCLSVNQMEDMQRYSALEIQTSAGVRTNEVTRLLEHIVGVHQDVLLKVSEKHFIDRFPVDIAKR